MKKEVKNKCEVSHFNYFWKIAILPAIEKVQNELDKDFVEESGLKRKRIIEYKSQLKKIYKEKREWLKKVYLPHEDEPCLDFHKLSAVICRAIIAVKPFKFNVDLATKYAQKKFPEPVNVNEIEEMQVKRVEWFVANVYCNYKVAFFASVGIAYLDLYISFIEKNLLDLKERLAKQEQFIFYPKSENHDSYENSMILALAKNDILERDFDYLAYATNMFQLQQYNKVLLNK